MTLPSPARLLCAAVLSLGLLASGVPALANDATQAPSPSTSTAPGTPAEAPSEPASENASPAPTTTTAPAEAAPSAEEPESVASTSGESNAEATPAAQDEVTSFVPDLNWNPLDDPNSNARYGEHYTQPVTPMKAASPLSTDGSAGTAALAPRTGDFKVTLVTVQLAGKTKADTDAINMTAARNSITSASAYWKSVSNNRLSMTKVNEYRHVSAARITDSYGTIMATVTRELAWQYRSYEALVIFVPHADLNYNGQWGILGGGFTDSSTSGRVIMPYPSALTNNVVTHEFGHVLGLHHANSLACSNGRQDVPRSGASWTDPACWSSEYGDTSDLMGFAQVSLPRINAFLWEYGGFGGGQEVRNLGIPSAATRAVLKPWGGNDAGRAVKFTDPVSKEVYYIELRLPVGNDAATATGGNRGVKITKQDVLGWSGNASIVLTPNSLRSGWGNTSLAWQQGQTFRTHAGTTVTINAITASDATVTVTPSSVGSSTPSVVLDKSLIVVNAGDFNGNGTDDLLSRRADGNLWFQDGMGNGSFRAPAQVGTGWGVFSQLIGGQDFNGDGRGDVVGRKTDGTLWFYAGTGQFTASNKGLSSGVRSGQGWNSFDIMISSGDFSGDGRADLIGRKSDGTLWLYPGTGTSPAIVTDARRIGTGWSGFNMLVGAGDYSGDGRADVLARTSDGRLWLYAGTGNSGFLAGRVVGSGWSGFADVVGASDFNGDSLNDLVGYKPDLSLWFYAGTVTTDNGLKAAVRAAATGWADYTAVLAPGDYNSNGTNDLIGRRKDGTLWFLNGTGQGGYGTPVRIGSGWNNFTQIVAPGDFNSDGKPDLLAKRTDGSLWFYPGTGTGFTREGQRLATDWQNFDQLMAPGDYNSDGKPDLIARSSDGVLWFYPGTGNTTTTRGYGNATRIGPGWQIFTRILTPGDYNGDGHNDLVAAHQNGTLWLYPGTGTGSSQPGRQIGSSGWNNFTNLLGHQDFNGDRKPDLLGTKTDGSLWLYAGTGMPITAGSRAGTPAGNL